ncbi:MAG TPA: BTAD domain-containing putative transcriptional regulator [Gemmatimonadaceae bacterium]|nr:BTAD domain-containing putative transcriptional regulator [Gemmatimonadaceae bacterium]
MLRFLTLGTLGLSGDSGPLLAGRRKVLALLAYIAREKRPVPRARLASLFWSDRDEQHARHSVRQAIAELRTALGDGLVVLDDGTVTLAPDSLLCDATEFEATAGRKDWNGAAALWHGDFLPAADSLGGLDWIHWLDGQRDGLRALAAVTFSNLATAQLEAGNASAAVEFATQWCKVAPLDERANACRIEALISVRRLVDAARCYEMYVRQLAASGLAAPSPQFLALRERLFSAGRRESVRTVAGAERLTLSALANLSGDARALLEAAATVGEPSSVAFLAGLSELLPATAAAVLRDLVERGALVNDAAGNFAFASEETRRTVYGVIAPNRRRALHSAIVAALERQGVPRHVVEQHRRLAGLRPRIRVRRGAVLGAVAASLALIGGSNLAVRLLREHTNEGSRSIVLTVEAGRLTVERQSSDAIIGAAMVGLRQSPHIRIRTRTPATSGDASTPLAGQPVPWVGDPRFAGPRLIVDVGRSGTLYAVAVRVVAPDSTLLATERAVGSERDIVDKLDTLLRRIRSRLGESPASLQASARPLRLVASASLRALAAYVDGMRAYEQGDRAAAQRAWVAALSSDSTFALAALELATNALEQGDKAAADRWVSLALGRSDRLAPRDSARARFLAALVKGAVDSAIVYARVAQQSGAAIWNLLGWHAFEQRRCDLAVPAFTRSISPDAPTSLPYAGLALCAFDAGDLHGALSTFARAESIDTGELVRDGILHRWASLLTRGGYSDEAEAALGRVLGKVRSATDSASVLRDLSALAMFRGRYASALDLLEEAARLLEPVRDSATLFAIRVSQAAGHLARGSRQLTSERLDQAFSLGALDARDPVEMFQLGHLMARIGRVNGAREVLRLLESRAEPARTEHRWAEALLRASIALAERMPEDALAQLGSLRSLEPPLEFLEGYRLALRSDARAMAMQPELARADATELEDRWFLFTPAQDEWLRSTGRVARLSELAGDAPASLAAYRRLLERWKDGDRDLVELAHAQRAVARLANAVALGR